MDKDSFNSNVLKKNKLPNKLKKELLRPTKIYVSEILNLCHRNLIHSAANITGGGIIENIVRSIPDNLTINIDLSKIKVQKIFSWLKSKNISDNEMIKTFNCLPIEGNLKFVNNSLYIDLGEKHGLRNRQIGIIKKNYQNGHFDNFF